MSRDELSERVLKLEMQMSELMEQTIKFASTMREAYEMRNKQIEEMAKWIAFLRNDYKVRENEYIDEVFDLVSKHQKYLM